MQRYHASGCTSAVNNNATGGTSGRDSARAESAALPANLSVASRRTSQLNPYKLKCDKDPLNDRLGPPDYHPQTLNCPEETLTREYVQAGYRETIEGIEEAREILLSQAQSFNKAHVFRCKEAIRKRFRAINESRAQKRKAGQVYGVPLADSLLSKPGVFPELRHCGEDLRKKWIEGLSQQHKRLRLLADHVPHGYRKKSLFEVLTRNNVPLLRATWFIKVTYLNQVRPGSASISSGTPDKNQLSRTELWTKDVIDYLQYLLDELFSRNSSHSTSHNRDRTLYAGSMPQRNETGSAVLDGQEPSVHFKWWYMVRLLQCHHAEGLIFPTLIIEWVLGQLQEKGLFEIMQLFLPIIYGVLETLVLSQTYVRNLVGVAVRFLREPCQGGSDLVDNSQKEYTVSALVEMLRYLILTVPDTFVALDCFPLPSSVVSYVVNDGVPKMPEDVRKIKNSSVEVAAALRSKDFDAQYQTLAVDHVVSSIQKRANILAKAASPSYPGHSIAKALQALDRSLVQGDVRGAYRFLFEDPCDGVANESWIAGVSPCLRTSFKWIGTANLSFVCSVFFLCEWVTCDFRDFRTAPPCELKFTGKKDFSQVYVVTRLLKLKIKDLQSSNECMNNSPFGVSSAAKGSTQHNTLPISNSMGNSFETPSKSKDVEQRNIKSSNIFESPGPLHDIVVCWIDQHEAGKGEGFKRLQLLVIELIRSGIFHPHVYVRQLIVSGIMDADGPVVGVDRRKRHYQILKLLPGIFVHDALEEAGIAEGPQLSRAINFYSTERRLILRGLLYDQNKNRRMSASTMMQKHFPIPKQEGALPVSVDQWKAVQSSSLLSGKSGKTGASVEELKIAISVLLQLPNSSSPATDTRLDESQGGVKRPFGSIYSKMDPGEGTPGCEECKRAKRQKMSDERSSCISDEEDTWWMRMRTKSLEPSKADPPVKTKQVTRNRQKTVRKTQSLAQLASARIEGSQGASTSHACNNKVSCPHHRTGLEGETPKSIDPTKMNHGRDIVSIGKALKRLRILEKRTITVWLMTVIRQHVEETEKTIAKVGQFGRNFTPVDDRSSLRWKLGEDELSAVLYLMDVSNDLVSAVKFLIWLLPKVSSPNSSIPSARNILLLPRNVESQACDVGEAFLISSLRRYENILVAADLIPDVLSATVHRASSVVASNGRVSGSAALAYSRYLLKRSSNVASVIEWEKNFKATCDKRLLSELESGQSVDGELGFPLGVPAGVEDLDDFFRQKITAVRLSRVGSNMKDIVLRNLNVEDGFHHFFGKDRKLFASGAPKGPAVEKWDDGYQIAQKVISELMECIRQTGGAAQEGDPSLVSSAVSAILSNVGPVIAKVSDFRPGASYSSFPSTTDSLNFARRILRAHICCLCLLKEALGERQTRVFEVALGTEACSALSGVFAPGKASRNQYQSSSESHDSNTNMSNDTSNSSTKVIIGKTTKIAAAVSALIMGAVVQGVTSLERLVTVFRLKERLDIIQFVRNSRSNSNGNARSAGAFKGDTSLEVYVHLFRLLVGNFRTVSDGLVVELLGEPSVIALFRMQRMLPLSLVFPPAYSIFAFVVWRPLLLNTSLTAREDFNQLYQSITTAMGDAIKHSPFRDVCLRDSQGFYDLVAADDSDAEFAAMLELNGSDMHLKSMAFVPLRARLFLNAIMECKMSHSFFTQGEGNQVSGHGESKRETKLVDKLVHILDTLQPAKFHWQWVELRLLLNEQALIEKLETQDMSLVDAIRSSSPSPEKTAASENEKYFIEIILTRLLVRPDAAPLFSDVVHLFGRSLADSMLLQVKWFLGGPDVLFGRKTIRQRLLNIAENKGLSTKTQFWKPWGWCSYDFDSVTNKGDKKFEVTSLEEGEMVEEGIDSKKSGKGSSQTVDNETCNVAQQRVTEKALIGLLLPCIDQCSDDSRNTFANDLIKQLSNIELQISAVTRGINKHAGPVPSGIESPTSKANNRKGIRGGSPGLVRRAAGAADSAPPSPAALRASMLLRLQLLLRLLPIICADREPSGRNMRHALAAVVLRLLGNRVVHEDADPYFNVMQSSFARWEAESSTEADSAALAYLPSESLFDQLLLVLHGLLSSCQPSWLRSTKSTNDSGKGFASFDRELVDSLQNDLDRMQLPEMIRWRIQTAMPAVVPSIRCFISCQPPPVPNTALAVLQPSIPISGLSPGNLNPPQRNQVPLARTVTNTPGKSKSLQSQDYDMDIDPWMLLEDGAGSGPSSSTSALIGSADHGNLRASSWLKGVVRVRRKDLTYIGAVDDDS